MDCQLSYLWRSVCCWWRSRQTKNTSSSVSFFKHAATLSTSWHDVHLIMNEAFWSMRQKSACLTFHGGSAPLCPVNGFCRCWVNRASDKSDTFINPLPPTVSPQQPGGAYQCTSEKSNSITVSHPSVLGVKMFCVCSRNARERERAFFGVTVTSKWWVVFTKCMWLNVSQTGRDAFAHFANTDWCHRERRRWGALPKLERVEEKEPGPVLWRPSQQQSTERYWITMVKLHSENCSQGLCIMHL